MAATPDRLPWLTDEPSGASAKPAQKKGAGVMWPWYLLFALLIVAVGAGAWWLSTGRDAPAPQLPAEESIPIPVTQAPVEELVDEAASNTEAPEPAAAAPVQQRPAARSAPPRVTRSAQRVAERARTSGRGIFPADEPTSDPLPTTGPTPVVLYHPDPNRGRVVQLGAFPTRKQAEANWRSITRRYPYLTSKPKMVNTVDVRGIGGGRPTRMYRLQLGTSSQAQSVVICQQLERAGHSCVVVY